MKTEKKIKSNSYKTLIGIVALIIVTWITFKPALYCDFLEILDDNEYILDNPHVLSGLSIKNMVWAFTAYHSANWHPLTWISHMTDITIFGLNPAGHHLTNLIFHILNALLLYKLFLIFSKSHYKSLLIAIIFAIHPLRVESVAWISERKDLLSTFFFILTLIFYHKYVKNKKLSYYFFSFFCYTLGLLSKPMLVTVPFVLFLIDLWPLKRKFSYLLTEDKNILIEKIPFFFFSFISIFITLKAQSTWGAVISFDKVPLVTRLLNIPIAYFVYLYKMLVPIHLSIYYPYNLNPNWVMSLFMFISFCGIVFICLANIKIKPWLFSGWFWYAGMLVPVIGLVQVGPQAVADRYTYIPMIGITIPIVWIFDIFKKGLQKKYRIVINCIVVIVLTWWAVLTNRQIHHWKNSYNLFTNAISIIPHNAHFHYLRGLALYNIGKYKAAATDFQKALRLDPKTDKAFANLGRAYVQQDKIDSGLVYFNMGLKLNGYTWKTFNNFAHTLMEKEEWEKAISIISAGIKKDSSQWELPYNRGIAYRESAIFNKALCNFTEALKLSPGNLSILVNRAATYDKKREYYKSISDYLAAHKLKPTDPTIQLYIARTYTKLERYHEAQKWYYQLLKNYPGNNTVHEELTQLDSISSLIPHKKLE